MNKYDKVREMLYNGATLHCPTISDMIDLIDYLYDNFQHRKDFILHEDLRAMNNDQAFSLYKSNTGFNAMYRPNGIPVFEIQDISETDGVILWERDVSKIDLVKLKLWCYEGLLSESTPLDKVEIEALSTYLTYLENVPLTIDELEEMTGDPIYITSLYDDGSIEYGYWTIVPPILKADETIVFGPDYKYEEKSSYGSDWLAYRFCVKLGDALNRLSTLDLHKSEE